MKRTIEDQLLNPRPGSACARARDFGIDLTLTLGRLKRTPDERLRDLQRAMIELESFRKVRREKGTSAIDPIQMKFFHFLVTSVCANAN
ncbi:MAG: hypothetical protein ABIP75_11300 [Pyrinomonadaceae bacterium]